jgi:ADP-heptose:LPS heptosyltransferase
MRQRNCFIFKPDGIGDFFLASGVIRLLSQEFGEENLTLALLPIMESVARGQFPRITVITLPLRTQRIILNKFVANSLRCFFPWLTLLGMRVDLSISLRNMRDYLQTFLFFSVRSPRRVLCTNPLLENNRPVRRWTEGLFKQLFHPYLIEYPKPVEGIPNELEAHRKLLSVALGREVSIKEIWPQLKAVAAPPINSRFWVCAPFSSGPEKDFPLDRWVDLFLAINAKGKLPTLVLTASQVQKDHLMKFHSMIAAASPEIGARTRIIIPDNLQDFIDLLAGAECVTTVDTAAAHAATALDVRTLILFSGKHQGMFAPWVRSSKQCWLLPKSGIPPEQWHRAHETMKIMEALEAILIASLI